MSNILIHQKPWIEELVFSTLTCSSSSLANKKNQKVNVRFAQLIEEPHYIETSSTTTASNNNNNSISNGRPIQFVISDGTNQIPVIIPFTTNTIHSNIIPNTNTNTTNTNYHQQQQQHQQQRQQYDRLLLKKGCLIKLRYYHLGLMSLLPFFSCHNNNNNDNNLGLCLIIEHDEHKLQLWNSKLNTRTTMNTSSSLSSSKYYNDHHNHNDNHVTISSLPPCIESVGSEGMGIVGDPTFIQFSPEVKRIFEWLRKDEGNDTTATNIETKIQNQIMRYYTWFYNSIRDDDNNRHYREISQYPGSRKSIALFDYFKNYIQQSHLQHDYNDRKMTQLMKFVNNDNGDDDDDDDDDYDDKSLSMSYTEEDPNDALMTQNQSILVEKEHPQKSIVGISSMLASSSTDEDDDEETFLHTQFINDDRKEDDQNEEEEKATDITMATRTGTKRLHNESSSNEKENQDRAAIIQKRKMRRLALIGKIRRRQKAKVATDVAKTNKGSNHDSNISSKKRILPTSKKKQKGLNISAWLRGDDDV